VRYAGCWADVGQPRVAGSLNGAVQPAVFWHISLAGLQNRIRQQTAGIGRKEQQNDMSVLGLCAMLAAGEDVRQPRVAGSLYGSV
jgi:hypothetical protein